MTRSYTSKPDAPAARLAWEYFEQTEGKPPLELFFSQSADFYDKRAPGWTAYYGIRHFYTTYGAGSASIFRVASPQQIGEKMKGSARMPIDTLIGAIRELRSQTRMPLKDAKDALEAFFAAYPDATFDHAVAQLSRQSHESHAKIAVATLSAYVAGDLQVSPKLLAELEASIETAARMRAQ